MYTKGFHASQTTQYLGIDQFCKNLVKSRFEQEEHFEREKENMVFTAMQFSSHFV